VRVEERGQGVGRERGEGDLAVGWLINFRRHCDSPEDLGDLHRPCSSLPSDKQRERRRRRKGRPLLSHLPTNFSMTWKCRDSLKEGERGRKRKEKRRGE
jgi:hypothetical protein